MNEAIPLPSDRAATRRRFLGHGAVLLSAAAVAGAAGGLSACTRTPSGAGASIDALLADTIPEGAGLSAVAARGGEIAYCGGRGFADRAAGVGAGCGTVHDIGSVTKQFTAAAVLKLEAAGSLSTDDPMHRFIDGVPDDKRAITLHHLLTHTAGLVDRLGGDYDAVTREDMLAAVAESRPRSEPGTRYHYSNAGYSVLAAVVEQVSGLGYEEYLAEHLFAPAGMTRTGYLLPRWDPMQIAVEYDAAGKPRGKPNDREWAPDGPYWNLRGNGGILSTPPDMFRWHRALRADTVLPAAAKRKLFEPHVREGGGDSHYGYGWVVVSDDGRRTVWHNGGNGRSYAELTRHLDEDLMVFWASADVSRKDAWNLTESDITRQIADRLREQA